MTVAELWSEMDIKLIAILRGITPDETPEVVRGLLDVGLRAIEIPLNSPDPITSIGRAAETAKSYGPSLIGAGTVLAPEQVAQVQGAGGNLIVSPDVNEDVVSATVQAGMASFPGVFTATEAHRAIRLGATGLKFFPASLIGPDGITAIRATLPPSVQICVVGGVGPANFAAYRASGVHGFGLGTSLYRPGDSATLVAGRARETIDSFRTAYQN
ncbi:2-dehydro-3-deoxy-6-phosphogalactonate aldolase [Fluviibacterium sp. DFM31]|uniref:2-dehydro-3-deoxy-6-phosphogalactonate aldolase n=1 Tax=Meridianimarinicoccus marinus TaxID=3231483 RepID=A0ABV3L7N5_9RHOB